MKRKVVTLVSGAVLCVSLSTATGLFAGPINQREQSEQARIRQGVRSGELTPQEVRKLEKEQARIRTTEAKAKADGTVTPKERAKIEKELNHASRDIYRQKHDNQTR
jgi:uncharacterized membrane protein YebE (DUF533 family)